jgi:rhomboid protease GluP
MSISWGYSPKREEFIPLADFPADKYLIIVRQAIENLGWKLSHVSASGIIAYTPLSFQSYSEQITVRVQHNFVSVKSECIGMQLLFNDYGKNASNLERLFHEFDYVQYHLQDEWDAQVDAFQAFVAQQDDGYFEKEPLAIKNKVKNIFFLFIPTKGYTVAPVLLLLTVFSYVFLTFITFFVAMILSMKGMPKDVIVQNLSNFAFNPGVLNRKLVLEGDFWRLISYQFVHGSFRHLLFNMYAFVYLGLMLENKIGSRNFLLIYLLSGISGGLASIAYHENAFTIGASGAIMGLFGAMLALLINQFYERNANKALLVSTTFVLAIMLINGSISAMVDNACHIGGLLAGFAITFILSFDHHRPMLKKLASPIKYATVALVFGVFTYVVLAFTPVYQHKEFEELKTEFNQNMRTFDQVLWIRANYTPIEKEQLVYRYGIRPSKANLEVTKKMATLKLNKLYSLDRSLKTKLAKEAVEAAQLIMKDVRSNHRYRNQVSAKVNKLGNMQVDFADSLRNAKRR